MLRNPQREANRWASEGSVDRNRLIWIAEQVRGVPIRTRRALAAQLTQERDLWLASAGGVGTAGVAEPSGAFLSAMVPVPERGKTVRLAVK